MKLSKIFNKVKNIPKKVLTPILIAAFVLPAATPLITAQAQATMEGHTKSLNVTSGETQYKDSTSALVDDVVQVQLWHHNREMPDATKAKNTRVKFSVPSAQGKTQVITGTTSSDNANTITDSTTVNLSLDRARIEFIPGTAKFRYNKGAADGDQSCKTEMNFPPERCYATVPISDKVVTDAQGVNLDSIRGGPLTGCNAYHETVTIQVRVKADVVSVNKYVRHVGQGADAWKTSTTAKPGDNVEYLIRFKNEGNTRLDDIMVGDNLPKYNSYVNGSTMLRNGVFPDGISANNDNITKGGINVGNYMPGAVGYVWFKAKLDPISAYEKCGTYDVRNVGVVRPRGMNEFYNTAQVLIKVDCKEQQAAYSCDSLKAEHKGDRKVSFSAKASASGGASIQRYIFNFGDGTQELTTDRDVVEHAYSRDGQFVARVRVEVRVGNETKVANGDQCTVPISFVGGKPSIVQPAVAGKLPETGAGSVIATFFGVSGISGALYYLVGRRLGL